MYVLLKFPSSNMRESHLAAAKAEESNENVFRGDIVENGMTARKVAINKSYI